MKFDEIEARVQPLLKAASASDRSWLARLLCAPAAHAAFTALDNELFIRDQHVSGPLLIASASRGEGRTTLALLLAVMTCALDPTRRVLLVDADVDSGRLANMLGLPDASRGLGEWFDGGASLDECIHATALPNLWLTPLSGRPGRPIRLSPKSFHDFIDGVRNRFDLTVVDSPAGNQNRAILSMAAVIQTTLLVVKYGGPTSEQIVKLLGDLGRAGAQVLGCVLNQREYEVPKVFYGQR